MAGLYLSELAAFARVAANGTALSARGVATATTGTGVYTLTLNEGIDALECHVSVTPDTTLESGVVHTSDTVKTVSFLDNAAAATDSIFSAQIFRISPPQ